MVSDTHCPALSDCELEWGEAGQRPRRGRCPVEHRGTFICLSVHPSVCADLSLEAGIWTLKDFEPEARLTHKAGAGGGCTDGQTNEREFPCVLQDIVPFRAAAQKGNPNNSAGLKKTEGTSSLRLFSKLSYMIGDEFTSIVRAIFWRWWHQLNQFFFN